MKLYKRPTELAPAYWVPEDTQNGKQAIEDVQDKTPDSYPVQVDEETARAIRERYEELMNA